MASNTATEAGSLQLQDKWGPLEGQGPDGLGSLGSEHPNGGGGDGDELHGQDSNNPDYAHSTGEDGGNQSSSNYREKQPNKVYIGGLPEHTRKEDLESCFGKIGNIVNIELKVGYGFVEFEAREAAEESVAKYHEGFFMGNKIRVELSHGGGRTAKYNGEPGACFKCGQLGHWARECPNHGSQYGQRRPGDAPLIDRIQPSRDYPPREYPPYRDDYPRYPPPRDNRYYDYPPLPPPGRDYRRPVSPTRDYPPGAPPIRRDYDDYRMRGPPPARYEARPYYDDGPSPYPPRGYGPPVGREPYDRRDPPPDRYSSYPPGRPRTPPGPPPRGRDDFDRPPPRDYPPGPEPRGRIASPRYDYPPPRTGSPGSRYRRRSQSPPPRSASGAAYDPAYPGGASGPPYSGGPSGGFAGSNGYSSNGGPPGPPRNAGSARDYAPRGSRDTDSGYRR